jgi:hypothetical protein
VGVSLPAAPNGKKRVECRGIQLKPTEGLNGAPSVCVGEGRTAGPSTALRSGRDDNSVVEPTCDPNELASRAEGRGGICGSLNSAEKVGDGGHYELLFLTGELGKDGQGQYFGCGSLTFRKGTGWESQAAEGGLLMERQGVVNL